MEELRAGGSPVSQKQLHAFYGTRVALELTMLGHCDQGWDQEPKQRPKPVQ